MTAYTYAQRADGGCVGPDCGTQATVMLHPRHGRLCPDHATLPTGPYRADLATDMCEIGRADAALRYLGRWLAVECDRRFDAAKSVRGNEAA